MDKKEFFLIFNTCLTNENPFECNPEEGTAKIIFFALILFLVNKFLAKTASNLKKPNGLKILFKSSLPCKIKKFKLSDLTGIGKKMEKRLILANDLIVFLGG